MRQPRVLSGLVTVSVKPLPSAVFGIVGIRFLLVGVSELGAPQSFSTAAGIVGLIVVALAGYSVVAFDLEGINHRPILPTFRRGQARAALSGTPGAALDDIVHEPGVRQMT